MIKKFDEFQVNELKFQTYYDAASKLRRKGRIHCDRADKIQKHAYDSLGKHLGAFNMNYDIIEKVAKNYLKKIDEPMLFIKNTKEEPTRLTSLQKAETTIQKAPSPTYITGALAPFLEEEPQTYDEIVFMIFGIPVHPGYKEATDFFGISIPIEWNNDTFSVKKGAARLVDVGENGIVKFSDRKSAIKFKTKFLEPNNFKKMCDEIDSLREFFMEHSEATEWDNLLSELRNINTNDLYE